MVHYDWSSSDISLLHLVQLKVILTSILGSLPDMSLVELTDSEESEELSLILSTVSANFFVFYSFFSLNVERFLKFTGDLASSSVSLKYDSISLESVLAKLNLASFNENLI